MILSSESLSTDVTGVRPLVGVGSLVYQQVVGLSEVTSTETTNILLLPPKTNKINKYKKNKKYKIMIKQLKKNVR